MSQDARLDLIFALIEEFKARGMTAERDKLVDYTHDTLKHQTAGEWRDEDVIEWARKLCGPSSSAE